LLLGAGGGRGGATCVGGHGEIQKQLAVKYQEYYDRYYKEEME
jgi:hypothetical protein